MNRLPKITKYKVLLYLQNNVIILFSDIKFVILT